MTTKQALKAFEDGEIDSKAMKLGKAKPQPKKPKSKFAQDVENNWNTITFAITNLFYITLGLSLMIVAGVAFWTTYKISMYVPFEYITRGASILVGLTAFVPMAKGLTRK